MPNTYWNPALETLSEKDLQVYEAPLLAKQIDYLYHSSDYYRIQFAEAGIDPQDINCHKALEAVPFTEKKTLAKTQREGQLIGPHQCAPREDIVRLVGTGGTSGKYMRIAWTRNDIDVYNETGARALWIMGCRRGDLVTNCFNYSIYAGGVMDHMAFETLGASVLAYGVGKSRELLELLADLPGEKCLYSTPSYIVRLEEVATQANINPVDLNLHKGFFSGEAVCKSPVIGNVLKVLGVCQHMIYMASQN